MDAKIKTLERLQEWYLSMCNGDWEHTYGLFISNVDNPGWSLKVELQDTNLYNCDFMNLKLQRADEHDWVACKKEAGIFHGYCGPKNLEELLTIFLNWAEANMALQIGE